MILLQLPVRIENGSGLIQESKMIKSLFALKELINLSRFDTHEMNPSIRIFFTIRRAFPLLPFVPIVASFDQDTEIIEVSKPVKPKGINHKSEPDQRSKLIDLLRCRESKHFVFVMSSGYSNVIIIQTDEHNLRTLSLP